MSTEIKKTHDKLRTDIKKLADREPKSAAERKTKKDSDNETKTEADSEISSSHDSYSLVSTHSLFMPSEDSEPSSRYLVANRAAEKYPLPKHWTEPRTMAFQQFTPQGQAPCKIELFACVKNRSLDPYCSFLIVTDNYETRQELAELLLRAELMLGGSNNFIERYYKCGIILNFPPTSIGTTLPTLFRVMNEFEFFPFHIQAKIWAYEREGSDLFTDLRDAITALLMECEADTPNQKDQKNTREQTAMATGVKLKTGNFSKAIELATGNPDLLFYIAKLCNKQNWGIQAIEAAQLTLQALENGKPFIHEYQNIKMVHAFLAEAMHKFRINAKLIFIPSAPPTTARYVWLYEAQVAAWKEAIAFQQKAFADKPVTTQPSTTSKQESPTALQFSQTPQHHQIQHSRDKKDVKDVKEQKKPTKVNIRHSKI